MRHALLAVLVTGAVSGAGVAASAPPPPQRQQHATAAVRRAAILAAGETILLRHRTRTAGCRLGALPDRRCSPGAYYRKLTKRVICSATFRTDDYRNVTLAEKHDVEVAYGLAPRKYGRTLEIDHIVSLELGGSNDIANLYPERRDAAPGYRVKDKLENRLHDLVCDGGMALRTARSRLASNWTSLYTRVFGRPPAG